MIPEPTLSEWQVRLEAEQLGWPTTNAQFRSYVRWGLLQKAADGRWPAQTVRTLVRIRTTGERARALPRRVVRLRGDYIDFPIATPLLRQAMIEMASPRSMSAPRRKLNRINSAVNQSLARSVANIPPRHAGANLAPPIQESWVKPPIRDWRSLLHWASDDEYFETRAAMQYHADYTHGVMAKGIWPTDDEIPFEERILLLMVRHLSVDKHWADLSEQRATATAT